MSSFLLQETLLRNWISLSPGAFSVTDLTKDVEVQQLLVDELEKLVLKGVVDRHGDRRGWYIPRQIQLEKLDYKAAAGNPIDIWLPFDLSDHVSLYPGSVVIVSGAPNSGKTALLLNVIRFNQPKEWDIHYFNSEMGADELKIRLEKFYPEMVLSDWTFNAYFRSYRFSDVIFPGPNSLNIIDFLEVHDEFYKVGKAIKEIHDKLKGGIAIIALQKNPGSDTGLGGYRTMEVARLVLAMDSGRIKITKAKNFKDPTNNPNGKMRDFKLVDGCKIIDQHGWYREQPKE